MSVVAGFGVSPFRAVSAVPVAMQSVEPDVLVSVVFARACRIVYMQPRRLDTRRDKGDGEKAGRCLAHVR